MSEPIHGRILHVQIQKAEEGGMKMKNLLEEQSSTLYINETFVAGAGSSARTTRHYAKRKSWKISSTMLFNLEDFGRIFLAMRDSEILGVSFGHEYNGVVFDGNAFPTKVTVTGNVNSLVKCQVEWQGSGKLEKKYVGDAGIYGVVIDTSNPSPTLERVGNMSLHQILPVQSRMRRCLLLDDGSVNYYLDENDSTLKADGSPANLDGSDGMVMVEIPKHYRRLQWIDSTRYRVDISESPMEGAIEVPKMYTGAFMATIDRENDMLSAVVNKTARYRGGKASYDTKYDNTPADRLGLSAYGYTHSAYRNKARNRGNGWNMYEYRCHLALVWLYVIEYANLNSQLDYNPDKTSEGYMQGGLGMDGTNLPSSVRYKLDYCNTAIPTGCTLPLGNHSGRILYSFDEAQITYFSADYKKYIVSYRGVENFFGGETSCMTDGIALRRSTNSEGVQTNRIYIKKDASSYSTSYSSNTRYSSVANPKGGTIKKILANKYGDIVPTEVAGNYGTVSYFCDIVESTYDTDGTYLLCVANYDNGFGGIFEQSYVDGIYTCTRLCYCSEPNCFIEV